MTKQSNKGARAASKEAADNWDAAPAPGSQNPEPKQEPGPKPEKLPKRPKTALVEAFKEVALVVGADKAKRLLVEQYGTENPEDLKVSQLMDAIDDLYGAE